MTPTLRTFHRRLSELAAVARDDAERRRAAGWAGVGGVAGAAAGLASARGRRLAPNSTLRIGDVVARSIGGIAEHRGVVVPGANGGMDVIHSQRVGSGQQIARQSLKDFRPSALHSVGSPDVRQSAARRAAAAVGGPVTRYNVLTRNSDNALRRATGGAPFASQAGRAIAGAAVGAGAGYGLAKLRARLVRKNDDRLRRAEHALGCIRRMVVQLSTPPQMTTPSKILAIALSTRVPTHRAISLSTISNRSPVNMENLDGRIMATLKRIPVSSVAAGGAGLAAGAALGRLSRSPNPEQSDGDRRKALLRRAAFVGGGALAGSALANTGLVRGVLGSLAAKRGIVGALARNPKMTGGVLGGLAGGLFETQARRTIEFFDAAVPSKTELTDAERKQIGELVGLNLDRNADGVRARPYTISTIASRALMPEADVQRAIEEGILRPVQVQGAKYPMFAPSDVERLRAESLRHVCLKAVAENGASSAKTEPFIAARAALVGAIRAPKKLPSAHGAAGTG